MTAGRGLVAAALLAGCATGAPRPETGPFVAAGFSPEAMIHDRVAVLPVNAVRLPETTRADADSLAAALAVHGGEVAAQALSRRGVAGVATGPGALAGALSAVGPTLGRAYEALRAGPPERETGGALSDAGAEAYETLADVIGARFFLVPLSIGYEAVAPLRFRATVEAGLVDAGARRTVWRGRVAAENPGAPPGDAADLFAAALENATTAVADRLARRLGEASPAGGPPEDR